MTATASNKNNQVYLTADGTDYRRVETVPVHNGTVLTIRCGGAAEATSGPPAITPTTYTVTVSQEGGAPQGDMDVSLQGPAQCTAVGHQGLLLYRWREG